MCQQQILTADGVAYRKPLTNAVLSLAGAPEPHRMLPGLLHLAIYLQTRQGNLGVLFLASCHGELQVHAWMKSSFQAQCLALIRVCDTVGLHLNTRYAVQTSKTAASQRGRSTTLRLLQDVVSTSTPSESSLKRSSVWFSTQTGNFARRMVSFATLQRGFSSRALSRNRSSMRPTAEQSRLLKVVLCRSCVKNDLCRALTDP